MFYAQFNALYPFWKSQLPGARLQQIYAHTSGVFSLKLYLTSSPAATQAHNQAYNQPHTQTQFLVLNFSQGKSTLALCDATLDLPARQPATALTMQLRKYLKGQKIVAVQVPPEDKCLHITFTGGEQLVLELSGRHGNLFVLNAEKKLLALLRPDASQRNLRIGQTYLSPEPGPKFQHRDPLNLEQLPDVERQRVFARHVLLQLLLHQQRQGIRRLLQQEKKRQKALQQRLQQAHYELEHLDQAEHWRRYSELLQSAYAHPPDRGATQVTVPDYYGDFDAAGETPMVEITLRADLSLSENIALYSRRAKKRERAAEYALNIIPELEEQLAALKRKTLDTLVRWDAQLAEHKPLKGSDLEAFERAQTVFEQTGPSSKSSPVQKLPYRVRGESQQIWIGRSAKGNHALTFKYARGKDYWLHVQDSPGSHVILRAQSPSPEALREAAHWAIVYSPLQKHYERGEPVSVSYTQVKHVKAIKGAKPGMVQLQQFKTLRLALRD